MSDPVTNVEIEDVLASIRRLVLTGGPPGAALAVAPSPLRSRLVLTQAQRIGDESDAEREPATPPSIATARAPLLVLSAPMPRVGPAAQPTFAPAWGDELEAPAVELAAEPVAVEPVATVASSARPEGLAAGARGIEAAVTGRAEAWDPDGNEEALDWSLGGVALAVEAPVFRHQALAGASGGPVGAPGRGRTVEAAEVAAPIVPPAAPTAMIDEAQLRAIVTEVLRAELAGELGERITRNVRKLVRREIFRVLEVREDD